MSTVHEINPEGISSISKSEPDEQGRILYRLEYNNKPRYISEDQQKNYCRMLTNAVANRLIKSDKLVFTPCKADKIELLSRCNNVGIVR